MTRGYARLPSQLEVEMTLLRARAEEDVSLMTTRSPRDGDDPTLLGLRSKTAAQKERCIIHSTQLNESLYSTHSVFDCVFS